MIEMPSRIAKLPRDERGFPIPWNVLIGKDGKPIFTVNDQLKTYRAIRLKLCPICGEPNNKIFWFVGGPKSAFDPNGWYLDLPGHEKCIAYALQVCPYLAAKHYKHRIDVVNPENVPDSVIAAIDMTQDPNRPEVFVMVAANRMEFNPLNPVAVYVRPVKRLATQFWRKGQRLTKEEAQQYINVE